MTIIYTWLYAKIITKPKKSNLYLHKTRQDTLRTVLQAISNTPLISTSKMERLFKDVFETIKNYETLKLKYSKLEQINAQLRDENLQLKTQLAQKCQTDIEIRFKTLQIQNQQLLQIIAGTISLEEAANLTNVNQNIGISLFGTTGQQMNISEQTFEQPMSDLNHQIQDVPLKEIIQSSNHVKFDIRPVFPSKLCVSTSKISEDPPCTTKCSTHQLSPTGISGCGCSSSFQGADACNIPEPRVDNQNDAHTSQFAIFQSPPTEVGAKQTILPAIQLNNQQRAENSTAFQIPEYHVQKQNIYPVINTKEIQQPLSNNNHNNFNAFSNISQQLQQTNANNNINQNYNDKINGNQLSSQQSSLEEVQEDSSEKYMQDYTEQQYSDENSNSEYQENQFGQEQIYSEGEEAYEEYLHNQELENYVQGDQQYQENHETNQDFDAISISSDSEY